jgi:AbrB family looped-hinge helix DNA binding protein
MRSAVRRSVSPTRRTLRSPPPLANANKNRHSGRVERSPPAEVAWYAVEMSGTYAVVVGDRGRLVIPSEVREAAGIEEGTRLMLLPTNSGLVLLTREQLRERVREDLSGVDLFAELLADRRKAATEEDAA